MYKEMKLKFNGNVDDETRKTIEDEYRIKIKNLLQV
jgi:ribosome-associated protein YbcJ (S4-like RNA binding protein)